MSGQTITKTLVDGLEPAASEYTIWDGKLPGFGVRVRPSGARSFIIVYRAGTGRTAPFRRYTVGAVGKMAPEAARTQAKILLGNVANGADPAAEKRAKRPKAEQLTFDELAQRYIDEYAKPNKSSWENDVGYLKRPRTALKHVLASSVTDDDIADVLDEIAEDAPVSANRAQSVIHKMFEWARQPGRKYVPSNPIHGMERRGGSETSRTRVLSDEEIKTLWSGLEHPDVPSDRQVGLALKLVLTTMIRPYQAAGALRVELHGLQTSAAEYHMPSHRVKGRREVVVPLSPLAVEVIGLTNSENQIPVFPSRYGEEPQAIRRSALSSALNGRPAKKKRPIRKGIRQFLGMEHFTPHDLRRTAATIARRAGAPRDDVKAVLDHVDGDVTAVYDKYDMLAEKRAVANILADELRKIIGTKSDSAKPALNFDRSNVVPVEEQISVTGQI
jgi:integrase